MGKHTEAQKAFGRARLRYKQEHLAKPYQGMVLGQDGDRQGGLGDWLDDLERNHSDGLYWDPGVHLRKEILRSLAMVERRDIRWSQLIAIGERLGREFEEEIDESQKQFEDNVVGDGDGGGNG